MDKKRIGIYYNTEDSWIGGKYYLDGIINVLNQNPNNEIIFLKRSFISRLIGKLFGKKSKFYQVLYKIKNNKLHLDVVFPYLFDCYESDNNIAWIPDFQENYYPEFFSVDEICARLSNQTRIAYSNNNLVLSSESAKKDFERLFPNHVCKITVLKFISTLYGKIIDKTDDTLSRYNIDEPFFICSNQFWKHKNHIIVINAIKELKEKGYHVLCVFTGKEEDYREPDYPTKIKNLVKTFGLEKEIRFLGFISRNDQIDLIRKSLAVIQPSLFEGWNTTIEDAKVCNKLVIASSLQVHKEQLKDKGLYFDVTDYKKLAELMYKTKENELKTIDYSYERQVEEYNNTVMKIFE